MKRLNTMPLLVLAWGAVFCLGGACSTFGSATDPEPDAAVIPSSNLPDATVPDVGALDGTAPKVVLTVSTSPAAIGVKRRQKSQITVKASPVLPAQVSLEPEEGVTAVPVALDVKGEAVLDVAFGPTAKTGKRTLSVRVKLDNSPEFGKATFEAEVSGYPGDVDEGFATNGRFETPLLASNLFQEVRAVDAVVLPDDSLIVAGDGNLDPFIWKFSADGVQDMSFGQAGTLRFPQPHSFNPTRIGAMLYANGKTYISLYNQSSGPTMSAIYSLDQGGALTPLIQYAGANMPAVYSLDLLRAPNVIVASGAGGSGWVLSSLVDGPTPGRDMQWGLSGFAYQGPEPRAVAFAAGQTVDYAILAQSQTYFRKVVTLSKTGVVLSEEVPSLGVGGQDIVMGAYVESGDKLRAYFGMRDGSYVQRVEVAPGIPTTGQRVSSIFEPPTQYDMAFSRLVARGNGVDYLLARSSTQTLAVSAVDAPAGAPVPGFANSGVASNISLSAAPTDTVVGRILFQKKGRVIVLGRVGVGSPVGQQVQGRPAITRLWL